MATLIVKRLKTMLYVCGIIKDYFVKILYVKSDGKNQQKHERCLNMPSVIDARLSLRKNYILHRF